MLGARLQEEVLLIDFDLHYGSLMLALDLEAIDALREALDQPDRIDALFIQQVAQKKSEYPLRHGRRGAAGRRLPGAPACRRPTSCAPSIAASAGSWPTCRAATR